MIYALNHVVMCVRSGSCALIGIVPEGFTVPETVITK